MPSMRLDRQIIKWIKLDLDKNDVPSSTSDFPNVSKASQIRANTFY